MKLITLEAVSKAYAGTEVLHEISLEIDQGERLVILGPSGCGKTTILRLLAGFIAPDAGRIAIAGETVAMTGRLLLPPEKREVGMVFQDLALWPHLSVHGNIAFGLKARHIPGPDREERIRDALNLVGLTTLAHRKPAELSGGQQQRVALARALVLEPRVLLMDEPLSSLDPELNQRLRQEIISLQEHLGFTLIYVTHDREEAFTMATRILVMESGKIVSRGPVAEIRETFELATGL